MKKFIKRWLDKRYYKKLDKQFNEIRNDCFIALYGEHFFETKAKYYSDESKAVKMAMDNNEFEALKKSASENLEEDFSNARKNLKIILKRPGKVYRFIDVVAEDLKLTSDFMSRYFGEDPSTKIISKQYHIGMLTSIDSTMKTLDMKKPNIILDKKVIAGTVAFVDVTNGDPSGLKPHQEIFVHEFIEKNAIR